MNNILLNINNNHEVIIMQKNVLNGGRDIHTEIETQPKDKKKRMENHILAESSKMGDLDIDKVKMQSEQLNATK